MWWQHLGLARDVSVILLVLEFLILGAIPLIILRVITRALGRFLPKVRPALRQVMGVVSRIQDIVTRVMNGVAAPVIGVQQVVSRVQGFLAALSRLLVVRREAE